MRQLDLARRALLQSGGAALATAAFSPLRAAAPATFRFSVAAANAQRFEGFGLSQPRGDRNFALLPPAVQDRALDLAYKDLPVRFFRAWVRSGVDWDAARMLGDFTQSYLDNGMLAKIAARCHPKLILAPGSLNEGPKISATDYARRIAELLAALRNDKGVEFEATGILNEPAAYPPSYLAAAAVALRHELDRRGLATVKIVAADWANVDRQSVADLEALRADERADAAIYAWANHSYNMASTQRMAQAARGKPRWVTEAGQGVADPDGPRASVNMMDAPTVAARVLVDLNLGVSRWFYFIGMISDASRPSPGGSRHTLVSASNAGVVEAFNRYFYLKQLLTILPPGSVMRFCSEVSRGPIEWSYGRKPSLAVACAVGPDGRVRLAAVNTTGIVANAISSYNPAQPVAVRFDLPWRSKRFQAFVTGTDGATRGGGRMAADNGSLALTVNPLELVTLIEA